MTLIYLKVWEISDFETMATMKSVIVLKFAEVYCELLAIANNLKS